VVQVHFLSETENLAVVSARSQEMVLPRKCFANGLRGPPYVSPNRVVSAARPDRTPCHAAKRAEARPSSPSAVANERFVP